MLTVILVVTALRSTLVDWNDVPTGSMVPTVAVGDRIVVNKLAYAFNLPFNGPVVSVPITSLSFSNPLDFLPGFYYGAPQPNDIVTFWKPSPYDYYYDLGQRRGLSEPEADAFAIERDDAGIRMVKRIVAGPGDTIQMVRVREKFDGRSFDFSKMILNGEEATYAKTGPYELTETLDGHSRLIQYVRNDPAEMRDRRGYLDPRMLDFGPLTLGPDQYLMIGDNRDDSQDGRFFGPVTLKQITGKAKFVAVSFNGSYFNPNWSRFFHPFDHDLTPAEPAE